jgi:hypothetical protein
MQIYLSSFKLYFYNNINKETMAKEIFLRENVLTDNILMMPDKGKIFKGGYIAIIKEYQFQNSWSDKEILKKFRSEDRLNSYLEKQYPEADWIDFEGTCLG